MRKVYLKWLVPIIALYAMIGVCCFAFRGYVKKGYVDQELHRVSNQMESGMKSADLACKAAVDYNDATAASFYRLNLYGDKEDVVKSLKTLVRNERVNSCAACTINGDGFNEKGEAVNFAKDSFFLEAKNNYGNGGKGLVLVGEDGAFPAKSVVIVNQVVFKDDTKGFLLSNVYIYDLADKIFGKIKMADDAVLISLNGTVLAGEFDGENFWDEQQYTLPVDTLKLNISQKNSYVLRSPGYGAVVMIPSEIGSGAALVVFSDAELGRMIRPQIGIFDSFMLAIMLCIAAFVVVNMLIYRLRLALQKRKATKETELVRIDKETGLYNDVGVMEEIKNYYTYSGNKRGVLFALAFDNVPADEKSKIVKIVANQLKSNYRNTDILGRCEDGSFMIFLKDIIEEKDVRKQTDELQIMLFDLKNDINSGGRTIKVSAGRAIYPDNGGSETLIFASVRRALEKSRQQGTGNISFCD